MRSSRSTNPNPVASGDDYLYPTSRQLSKDLLCGDCEDLFSKRGESWVMAKCSRGAEGFALREFLLTAEPCATHKNMRAYDASLIPEMDCDKLIFFAMSVFWRAGATTWPYGRKSIHIDLGSFLEPIGLFLLGGAFPEKMLLDVEVSSWKDYRISDRIALPESTNQQGFWSHHFMIPGLTFVLCVGSKIPPIQFCMAPGPRRFISTSPDRDVRTAAELRNKVLRVLTRRGSSR